jgi:hypothetical protein
MHLSAPSKAASAALAIILAASFLTRPAVSTNARAPLLQSAQIDPAVLSILRRSCADCHSDATRYPWYSYVAPVSLLIRSDIARGRERLNLSHWSEYPLPRRLRALTGIANQVKDREMPVAAYTFLHRDAKLSDADVQAVYGWAEAERVRLITLPANP